jgi:hypothetical protein
MIVRRSLSRCETSAVCPVRSTSLRSVICTLLSANACAERQFSRMSSACRTVCSSMVSGCRTLSRSVLPARFTSLFECAAPPRSWLSESPN